MLKYPHLEEGDLLVIQNSDYFCTQPRHIGREVPFVRYATEEEMSRGAGPYIIRMPNGNNYAALEDEIAPLKGDDEAAVSLDLTDW